jgi:hypothetical protein
VERRATAWLALAATALTLGPGCATSGTSARGGGDWAAIKGELTDERDAMRLPRLLTGFGSTFFTASYLSQLTLLPIDAAPLVKQYSLYPVVGGLLVAIRELRAPSDYLAVTSANAIHYVRAFFGLLYTAGQLVDLGLIVVGAALIPRERRRVERLLHRPTVTPSLAPAAGGLVGGLRLTF